MSGTKTNPIQFEKLLASNRVIAGDVIEMMPGTYRGDFVIPFEGVIFRAYKAGSVTIEGSLTAQKACEYHGLTIHQPDEKISAVVMQNSRFYDCDISGGFVCVSWFGSGAGVLSECAIHDCSSYGIYTHNNNGGLREIDKCTFENIGGYYDLHMYSESANAIRDYLVTGCTFNKFVVVHGAEITNIRFDKNTFNAPLHLGNGKTIEDTREATVTGNTFNGGIRLWTFSTVDIQSNTFVSTANWILVLGANEVSTVINNNDYTGGTFSIDGVSKSWAEWQAAGYDADGSYT